jgi:hypothetical protein
MVQEWLQIKVAASGNDATVAAFSSHLSNTSELLLNRGHFFEPPWNFGIVTQKVDDFSSESIAVSLLNVIRTIVVLVFEFFHKFFKLAKVHRSSADDTDNVWTIWFSTADAFLRKAELFVMNHDRRVIDWNSSNFVHVVAINFH